MNVQETVTANLPMVLGIGALALASYWAGAVAADAVEYHNQDVSAHWESQMEVEAVKADVMVIREQLSSIVSDIRAAKTSQEVIIEKLDTLIAQR